MKTVRYGLGALVVAFVLYFAGSPYLAVYQMRTAAQQHNGHALAERIDFPAVRDSLKQQMGAAVTSEVLNQADLQDNPFAVLGASFAGMMVNSLVDAFVTPSGIIELMSGELSDIRKAGKRAGKSGKNGGDRPEAAGEKPFDDISMAYQSFNRFIVTPKGKSSRQAKFILSRQGLTWKLTEIILPIAD